MLAADIRYVTKCEYVWIVGLKAVKFYGFLALGTTIPTSLSMFRIQKKWSINPDAHCTLCTVHRTAPHYVIHVSVSHSVSPTQYRITSFPSRPPVALGSLPNTRNS